MFELTPTLPNIIFGQMFKQIGTSYSQIWHTDNYGCDFEPCLISSQGFTLIGTQND